LLACLFVSSLDTFYPLCAGILTAHFTSKDTAEFIYVVHNS